MKTLASITLLLFTSTILNAQDLKGQWTGEIKVQGTSLRIVFHITQQGHEYKATLDSPDQNVSGIPVTTTSFKHPDVKLEIANLGVVYEGTLAADRITGRWLQSGQSLSVDLIRDNSAEKGK